jgi:hypothetical protein
MTLRDQLISVSDAFCAASGMSRARLSTLMMKGGARLDAIAEGGDLTTRSFEAAMAWLSANWPQSAVWPEGVERPALRQAQDEGVAS